MNPKNFITCETDDNTTDFPLITRYQLYRYMCTYVCVCVCYSHTMNIGQQEK